jgi:hypothetical protein
MEAITQVLFITLLIRESLLKAASLIQFQPIQNQTRQKVPNVLKSATHPIRKVMKTTK